MDSVLYRLGLSYLLYEYESISMTSDTDSTSSHYMQRMHAVYTTLIQMIYDFRISHAPTVSFSDPVGLCAWLQGPQ